MYNNTPVPVPKAQLHYLDCALQNYIYKMNTSPLKDRLIMALQKVKIKFLETQKITGYDVLTLAFDKDICYCYMQSNQVTHINIIEDQVALARCQGLVRQSPSLRRLYDESGGCN